MEELHQLRNLKKREVLERIERIKRVAGDDNCLAALSEEALEADFDPEKHDQMMQV